MTVRDLVRLYDYGYWANRKLLGVVAQLTPDQFTQTVAGSYGSVRNTLVHIVSAGWGWLDHDTWAHVETTVRVFLEGLSDPDLQRLVDFKILPGESQTMPLGELMHHAANHAVHHRGHVALLLRELGCTPGNFDLLVCDSSRHRVGA